MYQNIKKLFLFLLILTSTTLTLLLCELYLNYIHFKIDPPVFNNFATSKTSNSYRIDSHLIYTVNGNNNYRNPLKPKDSTKTNVAFVGDSVTWSFGANDNNTTYPKTFENLYNSSSNKKILVNNFGTPGYNLDQEYLLIKEKIIPEFQPDIIIWDLNVNDAWGSNYSCLFNFQNDQWSRISARHNIYYWYGAVKTFLSRLISKSKLLSLIWYRLDSHLTPLILKSDFTFGCSSIKYTKSVQQLIINKLDFFINDLKNDFQKRNIKLIITLVPYQQYLDNQGNNNQISVDFLALKEYFAKNKSINFIDYNESIPKTKNNTNPAEEYFLDFSNDGGEKGWRHPNQKMYDLMAITLKNYVQKNKF